MGTRFLLDTNSIIYYLDNALPRAASIFLDGALDDEAYISVISKIELLGWNPPEGTSLETVKDFVDKATILQLDDAVVQKTIDIRRSKRIKLPDAIIAATALVNGLEIISRNTSDFSGIAGLNCYDPFTDF